MNAQPSLALAFGLSYADLRRDETLAFLDQRFLEQLAREHPEAAQALTERRSGGLTEPLALSEWLVTVAPVLEAWLAGLFGITEAVRDQCDAIHAHDPVFAFKKHIVQRRARRRLLGEPPAASFAELDEALTGALLARHSDLADRELAIARYAESLLAKPEVEAVALETLTLWCIQALKTPEGRAATGSFVSFRLPAPLDPQHLVPIRQAPPPDGRGEGPVEGVRARDGFHLTDRRMSERAALSEAHYCIYCHDHDGDFCSKGFPLKKGDPAQGYKTNPLGSLLVGCPLEEKISEMHTLFKEGHVLAALAVVMTDNPMVPATGHRICNDCMKACIYQKQDPVNIPEIETRVLTDVLRLPWGVEIYDLLTRWNPLRATQWLPAPDRGQRVLIAGMGPAGFTLAHHLLMAGCGVVGIDGLKIEPLPSALVEGPVARYEDLEDDLATRVMAGFGGVAEYGITVRWDKNFLKLIYLSLVRRARFQVFGGVRFGGTLLLDDAWRLGFDHVAVATGAGYPRALSFTNSLARGMRQAVDFLMALQLTGAAKATSLTNLQVRLPAVVIGGGLTGIDTATEVQAYYVAQTEKILARYERLSQVFGEARVRDQLDEESAGILNEFLSHGRAFRALRVDAAGRGERPDFTSLIRSFGGVVVAYRRAMRESPAYLRNHEEIVKALEEGIYYLDGVEPEEARLDRFGHVEALVLRRQREQAPGEWVATDERVVLPARAVFIAAGSTPNTIYEREHPGAFVMEENHFKPYDGEGGEVLVPVPVAPHCKAPTFGPFTSHGGIDHRVSFLGDTHPVFHGTVVKAVASAKRSYPEILRTLDAMHRTDRGSWEAFRTSLVEGLAPRVQSVIRHSPSVLELVVRAPLAAARFAPGQFFRLQTFESHAPLIEGTRLQTEALAITGAHVDRQTGDISLMVVEVGASTRLCALLAPGDPVVLMGPTGAPTEIPARRTVLVIGGRRGAAAMRTIGPALRAAGSRVLYFAGFQTADEAYARDDLEAAADVIVWCTASGAPIVPRRLDDRAVSGDLIDTMARYARGELHAPDAPPIPLAEVERVFVVGSNRLIRMVREARAGVLDEFFARCPEFVASVGSPMQCMLKGVCSQCLQWHVDPATGRRTRPFFACARQDQAIDAIDLDLLDARLAQNRLQETLTNLWLDYLLAHNDVSHV